MENFSNDTIDTSNLPKFETVAFTKLHPSYWKVLLINIFLVFFFITVLLFLGYYNISDWDTYSLVIYIAYPILLFFSILFSNIGFKKKGFAFRTHDVLFTQGIIANNTLVIPYNRVQHVALHEGLIARYFGLATIEIFTAGGNSSDIEIPGIAKEQAENIKQLLMGKIQKQL